MNAEIHPGDVIAGKYRVRAILGRSHGLMVDAFHTEFDQRVIIKLLLAGHGDEREIERFRREARTLAKLESEHVARIIDVGTEADGSFYLVRQYLEGTDLATYIHKTGPIGLDDAVHLVLMAAEGVAETHSHGIIVRELEPEHLFLTQRPGGAPLIKIVDFGTAKLMRDAAAPGTGGELTATAMFGLSPYSSPELVRKAKNVDQRTDVWSLGAILYELLTGKAPFAGEAAFLMLKITREDPEPLTSLRPDLPPEIDQIIGWALAKDVDARFQSVHAFAHALAPYATNEGQVLIQRIGQIAERAKHKRRPGSAPPPAMPAPLPSQPRSAPPPENAYVAPPSAPPRSAPASSPLRMPAAPRLPVQSEDSITDVRNMRARSEGGATDAGRSIDVGGRSIAYDASFGSRPPPPRPSSPQAPESRPRTEPSSRRVPPPPAGQPAGKADLNWSDAPEKSAEIAQSTTGGAWASRSPSTPAPPMQPPPAAHAHAPKSSKIALYAIIASAIIVPLLLALVIVKKVRTPDSASPTSASAEASSSPPVAQASSVAAPPPTPAEEASAPPAVTTAQEPAPPPAPSPVADTKKPVKASPAPAPAPAPAPPPAPAPAAGGGSGTLLAMAIGGTCAFAVNGAGKGTSTSIRLQLKPGSYSVTCRPPSGGTKSKSVQVKAGETAMATFKL